MSSTPTYASDSSHQQGCASWAGNLCNCAGDSDSSVNYQKLGVQRAYGHRTPAGMNIMEHDSRLQCTSALHQQGYNSASSSSSGGAPGPSGQAPANAAQGFGAVGYQGQQAMYYPRQQGQQQQQQLPDETGLPAQPGQDGFFHFWDENGQLVSVPMPGSNPEPDNTIPMAPSAGSDNGYDGGRSSGASSSSQSHLLKKDHKGKGKGKGKEVRRRKDKK